MRTADELDREAAALQDAVGEAFQTSPPFITGADPADETVSSKAAIVIEEHRLHDLVRYWRRRALVADHRVAVALSGCAQDLDSLMKGLAYGEEAAVRAQGSAEPSEST